MNRSPLHDLNTELGARFTGFGGWEMPVQYQGVLAEHRAVREGVGFFDVSHLGRFRLTGSEAHQAVRDLLCNDIERIEPGRCQYTMILNADGGIIDDLIVWWHGEGEYWILPNAANHEKVMGLFAEGHDVVIEDLRSSTAMIAVQGPQAPQILEQVLGVKPGRFRLARADWAGSQVHMAGTGYTGEPGAELCVDSDRAADLVSSLVDAGVTPAGLGARDTLRLEAGLSLWGEDIDESTTPLEAGLGMFVNFDHDFVGRDALLAQRAEGVGRSRISFILDTPGVPRHGHKLRGDGVDGVVTSGNMSPILGKGIGLGYLSAAYDGPVEIEIRDRWHPIRQSPTPFHKQ